MLKNIVFDMGGVLLRFDRKRFMERLAVEPADFPLLERELFRSVEWAQMDRGLLEDVQAAEIICQRLPKRLHDAATKLITMWDRPILPIPGMEALIAELSAKGYGIFLLSNASTRQHEYWPRVPASRYFQDTLISADVKLVKPMPEIFLLAYQQFGIQPAESLFIDDLPPNVEAAIFTGMDGIVFHGDSQELRKKMQQKGVDVEPPSDF